MSFFRKKSGLEIPPVAGNDDARNELLGSRQSNRSGQRAPSPQPPPYRPVAEPSYNSSRDGDLQSNYSRNEKQPQREDPYGSRPAPDRYASVGRSSGARGAIGDPYSRGGNADADRAQLFSGYDANKVRAGGAGAGPSRNRFADDGPGASGSGEPKTFENPEDEDEEVEGIKQQTRFIKQESVNSTRNALRIAREAEETGRNTLLRLGDQSEKLANTERYIDQGKVHAARAEDKTDELKKLNRSIFRPAITFNKDSKRAAQDAKVAARYEEERTNRERGMADVRESQNRLGRVAAYGRPTEDDDDDEGIGARRRGPAQQAARKQANARYQFEATESDDEMENELDDNLDEIAKATGALRAIAIAAGEEVDRQNDRIDEIAQKTGKLNTRVDITTNRLKRIH